MVGGGPAGLATALFAAAAAPELAGRLVVLEKERYPREKFCAGAVGARADRDLASIGVSIDVPSVPIHGLSVRAGGRTRVVRSPGAGRVVRRVEFDHALANAARERGISVRDGVRVKALSIRGDGVTVRTSEGDVEADVVVGADGVGSIVRRELGFHEAVHRAQAVEVDTEPVASDVERGVLVFDLSRSELPGYYWDFPTVVDGRALVCRGVYYLRSSGGRASLEIDDVLAAELRARGLEPSRYKRKRYAERGFERRGPIASHRALLVGEAAGIDPITGEGIAQAIQYGAAAGPYLAAKLAASDFDLGDFPAAVGRASIGKDLQVRAALLGLAYGRYRGAVEQFLLDTPDFLDVGLAHFSGRPLPKRALARATLAALAATAKRFVLGQSRSVVGPGG